MSHVPLAAVVTVFAAIALAACGPPFYEGSGLDDDARTLHAERLDCDEDQIVVRRTDDRDVLLTIGCGQEATIACHRSYRHMEAYCGVRSVRPVTSGN